MVSTNQNNGKLKGEALAWQILFKEFNERIFKQTLTTPLPSATNLTQVLTYETQTIITAIKNNIKNHYISHLNGFINVKFQIKQQIKNINLNPKLTSEQKKDQRNIIYSRYRLVKNDIYNVTTEQTLLSDPEFHPWILENKFKIIPNKSIFEKNSIHYDVNVNSIDYLPCIISLNQLLDEINQSRPEIFQHRLFHALPLRTQIKPSYIILDTQALIQVVIRTNSNRKIVGHHDQIWNQIVCQKRTFKRGHNYVFNHMIRTDGVGVSICLIRQDLLGKKCQEIKKDDHIESPELYIDDSSFLSRKDINNRRIIGVDPNKRDIIFCLDQEGRRFRYTTNQRNKETHNKHYSWILERLKQEQIYGHSVEYWESQLSKLNGKTCNLQAFTDYLVLKHQINNILSQFYQRTNHRRMKFNRYINIQRSESQMINNFKKKYDITNPNQVLIAFGDHSQKQHQMKYHVPTKDIGIRKLFRRHGFLVPLVDEYRTSCRCHVCGHENESFLKRPNPRPYRRGLVKITGLLRCQSVTCKAVYNRDVNACQNDLQIAENALSGLPRPVHLMRPTTPNPVPLPVKETEVIKKSLIRLKTLDKIST